jgi:hypothetical protein
MINFKLILESALGGLSKGMSLEDIALKHKVNLSHIKSQLRMGLDVEKEHGKDFEETKRIAMDHLVENPNYYTDLKTMETSAKKISNF